jgi:hypothetical protein
MITVNDMVGKLLKAKYIKEMPGNLPGNFSISGRKYCNK